MAITVLPLLAFVALLVALVLTSIGTPTKPASPAKAVLSPTNFVDQVLSESPLPPSVRGTALKLPFRPLDTQPFFVVSQEQYPALAQVHEYFLSRQSTAQLKAYAQAHLPSGFRIAHGLTAEQAHSGQSGFELAIAAPPRAYFSGVAEYTISPYTRGDNFLDLSVWAHWGTIKTPAEMLSTNFSGSLTTYRSSSAASGAIGPVRQVLTAKAVAALVRRLDRLPVGRGANCFEEENQYTIVLRPRHPGPPVRVVGIWCGADVQVWVGGQLQPSLQDRNCSLLHYVTSLSPAAAKGTGSMRACASLTPPSVSRTPGTAAGSA